jgi:hypothetical protein
LRRSERWVIYAESRIVSFALHGRTGVPDTASEIRKSSARETNAQSIPSSRRGSLS